MIQFPKDFFWGAATSAYQVEGDNINCDWWEWEKRCALRERSGRACLSYELYEQDFDLAKDLGHNAHRLSIEWSRIEPEEGKFQPEAITHYINVILSLRKRNIEPIVTLHHFTNPLWFAKSGGWLNAKAYIYFLRYVEEIVGALCDKVSFWVTINEPLVYTYHSYILGQWPPQEKSLKKAKVATDNLIFSHVQAYRLIHNIYKTRNLKQPYISIAKNLQAFQPCVPDLRNKFATWLKNKYYNFEIIEKLSGEKALDYIGINYYTRSLVETQGLSFKSLLLDLCKKDHSLLKKNYLGWDIYPQGLYDLTVKLKKYNLPVFVLENGICTEDDRQRWIFIREHLKSLHKAMDGGVKVLGYIYWSLIDNYEWDKGFGPRFGLIDVDYNTYKRSVRQSGREFASVCKTGILT